MKKLLMHFLSPDQTPAIAVAPEHRDYPVHEVMASTQRELALFAAEMMGTQSYMGQFGARPGRNARAAIDQRLFRDIIEESSLAFLVIDPRPGLYIVDANDAYTAATMASRSAVVGNKMFDVFPDNPEVANANGVSNLYESLKAAAQTGRPHAMAVQRYDVRDATGRFVERHWQPRNTPIFDQTGRLRFLLHQVHEVPAEAATRERRATAQVAGVRGLTGEAVLAI